MENKDIILTRRITSPFLQAIPPQVTEFDCYIYAVIKRKKGRDIKGEFGTDVRIDPAILKLSQGIIQIFIPADINHGLKSIDDLQEGWYEAIEAAFLSLIYGCLP